MEDALHPGFHYSGIAEFRKVDGRMFLRSPESFCYIFKVSLILHIVHYVSIVPHTAPEKDNSTPVTYLASSMNPLLPDHLFHGRQKGDPGHEDR